MTNWTCTLTMQAWMVPMLCVTGRQEQHRVACMWSCMVTECHGAHCSAAVHAAAVQHCKEHVNRHAVPSRLAIPARRPHAASQTDADHYFAQLRCWAPHWLLCYVMLIHP